MPSPPAAVSSSHQVIAAARESGSVVSAASRRGGRDQVGVGGYEPVGDPQVPVVRLPVEGGALGGEELERRETHAGQAVGRPAVPPVGGGERGRVVVPRPRAAE